MKLIGLRFLLDYGHFLQIVLVEEEARKIVEGWAAGTLPERLCGHNQFGHWAIHTGCVRGIHTGDLQDRGMAPLPPGYRSGIL